MSGDWQFPRRVPHDKDVVSPEDLGLGLRYAHSKATSDIGEHNISESFATQVTRIDDFADGAVQRIAHTYNFDMDVQDPAVGSTSGSARILQDSTGFELIPETTLTFLTRGGPLMFCCRVNFHCQTPQANSAAFQFCLLFDGAPVMDFFIGGADTQNEPVVMEQGLCGYRQSAILQGILRVPPGLYNVSLGAKAVRFPEITTAKARGAIHGTEMFIAELS